MRVKMSIEMPTGAAPERILESIAHILRSIRR